MSTVRVKIRAAAEWELDQQMCRAREDYFRRVEEARVQFEADRERIMQVYRERLEQQS